MFSLWLLLKNFVFRELESRYTIKGYVCFLKFVCFVYTAPFIFGSIFLLLFERNLSHIFSIVSLPSCLFFPCMTLSQPGWPPYSARHTPNLSPYISRSWFICALLYATALVLFSNSWVNALQMSISTNFFVNFFFHVLEFSLVLFWKCLGILIAHYCRLIFVFYL